MIQQFWLTSTLSSRQAHLTDTGQKVLILILRRIMTCFKLELPQIYSVSELKSEREILLKKSFHVHNVAHFAHPLLNTKFDQQSDNMVKRIK